MSSRKYYQMLNRPSGSPKDLTDWPQSVIIWDGRVNFNFNLGGINDASPISSISSVSPATVQGVQANTVKQPDYFEDGFAAEDTAHWLHTSNHIIESTYTSSGPFTVICALNFLTIDTVTRYVFSGSSRATGIHLKFKLNKLILRINGVDTEGPTITTGNVIVICIIDGANSKFGVNLGPYTSADATGYNVEDMSFGGSAGAFVIGSLDAEVGIFGVVELPLLEAEVHTMVNTYATEFGITL